VCIVDLVIARTRAGVRFDKPKARVSCALPHDRRTVPSLRAMERASIIRNSYGPELQQRHLLRSWALDNKLDTNKRKESSRKAQRPTSEVNSLSVLVCWYALECARALMDLASGCRTSPIAYRLSPIAQPDDSALNRATSRHSGAGATTSGRCPSDPPPSVVLVGVEYRSPLRPPLRAARRRA
jgi:hypothetical protein